MFVASIVKIKTINKDVLDSEWALTSCALRLVCTSQQIRMCAMSANHVYGYIQQLGSQLFHVVFYCQQQVQLYMNSCKAGNATLDVDATGCIVRNIRGQKRTYYYCIVLGDCSIPMFDAVTTRHTSEWLQSLLMMFNASTQMRQPRQTGDTEVCQQ